MSDGKSCWEEPVIFPPPLRIAKSVEIRTYCILTWYPPPIPTPSATPHSPPPRISPSPRASHPALLCAGPQLRVT